MLDDRLTRLEEGYAGLLARLTQPDVLADHRRYIKLSRCVEQLDPIVVAHRRYQAALADLDAARGMLTEARGADREFVQGQIEEAKGSLRVLQEELRATSKSTSTARPVHCGARGRRPGRPARVLVARI